MDIVDSRTCNRLNLDVVARYYEVDPSVLQTHYDELLADSQFLALLNERISFVQETYGFRKGIFGRASVDSVDWFAFQRILLYVLTRHLRPVRCLETGVYYGGNTAFILRALQRNGAGRLLSIDLPDSRLRADTDLRRHPFVGDTEMYADSLRPGFIVPHELSVHWDFIEGNSLRVVPTIESGVDLAIHDSDHSFSFLLEELRLGREKMSAEGTIVVDDIHWSNGFIAHCASERLLPLFVTDNGKDGLLVRTGLARLDHPHRALTAVTGACS